MLLKHKTHFFIILRFWSLPLGLPDYWDSMELIYASISRSESVNSPPPPPPSTYVKPPAKIKLFKIIKAILQEMKRISASSPNRTSKLQHKLSISLEFVCFYCSLSSPKSSTLRSENSFFINESKNKKQLKLRNQRASLPNIYTPIIKRKETLNEVYSSTNNHFQAFKKTHFVLFKLAESLASHHLKVEITLK